jgi:hypothetical protein
MPLVPINLAQQSYVDRSPPVSSQRLVNLFVDAKTQESRVPWALLGAPGLRPWKVTSATGSCRGLCVMGELLYVVIGNDCYSYDVDANETYVGFVSGYGICSMSTNGTQLVIVADNEIFVATTTTFVTASIVNCVGVCHLDGYMVLAEQGSQRMIISSLYDAEAYDPTEFTLVNADPDNNKGITTANREILVFGSRSTQAYYNSGQADFPFSRNASGIVPRGCLSKNSIAEFKGQVAWLSDDRSVYALRGQGLEKISTPPIDIAIAGFTGLTSASGFFYSLEGHIVYVLSFTNGTICYDFTTDRWHERETQGLDVWRARCCTQFNELNIVGDYDNGNLYVLDMDYFSDDDTPIRRAVTSPPIHAETKRASMHSVELLAEVGVGLISGQGSDPTIMLDWSDDGGRTWSNEHQQALGPMGHYEQRVLFNRLGQFRTRTLRFAISDPVRVCFMGCVAELEGADA